jgi:hypothetical protein
VHVRILAHSASSSNVPHRFPSRNSFEICSKARKCANPTCIRQLENCLLNEYKVQNTPFRLHYMLVCPKHFPISITMDGIQLWRYSATRTPIVHSPVVTIKTLQVYFNFSWQVVLLWACWAIYLNDLQQQWRLELDNNFTSIFHRAIAFSLQSKVTTKGHFLDDESRVGLNLSRMRLALIAGGRSQTWLEPECLMKAESAISYVCYIIFC